MTPYRTRKSAAAKKGKGKPPGWPKQKGTTDKVPHSRAVKASIRAVIEDVMLNEATTVRQAVLRGFKAEPRDSHHFVKLAAEYTDGRPADTLNINQFNEDELATSKDRLTQKLDEFLTRVLAKA